ITDCMRAGLLEDGQYKLGEFDVTMKDGIARMDNGSLAGSTLLLIDGVRNLHPWSGESLSKIWHLASLSPAKRLEMDHNYGGIAAMDMVSLAGSTLRLIDGGRNLHQWTGESLSKIWHLASLSPAKSLEMDHNYGSIAEG